MAVISLRNLTARFEDGYTGPAGIGSGLINNMAGYAQGTTTITVDGYTGVVVTGDYFTIAGDVDEFNLPVPHKITSHTETAGATTSITFTPATKAAVADDAALTILPHFINVKIGEGNISYVEKRNIEYKLDRGRIDSVRLGNDSPVEVKVAFTWETLASLTGDPPTVEEFLKRTGPAANYVNAASDPCTPYSVRLIVTDTPPCTTIAPTLYQFDNFLWEELNHDVKNAQVDITAKCNIAFAQVTRVE
jgi:hypothetical protein